MAAGRPITRWGHVRILPVSNWTGTLASGQAFYPNGTVVPNGAAVEYYVATGNVSEPPIGAAFSSGTVSVDAVGGWFCGTVQTSGTYTLFVRRKDRPRVMGYMPFTVP